MLRYVNSLFTRMAMILVDSISLAAQGSMEAVGVLKFYPVQVWKKSAIETWGPKPVLIAGKMLQRIINDLEGLKIVARYRTYYDSVARELKERYRELKRRRRDLDV